MNKDKLIALLVILALVLGVLNLYQFWSYRSFQLSYSKSKADATPVLNQAPIGKYTFNYSQIEFLGGAGGGVISYVNNLNKGALGCGGGGQTVQVQGSGTLHINFWGPYTGGAYPATISANIGNNISSVFRRAYSFTSGSNYIIVAEVANSGFLPGIPGQGGIGQMIVLTVPVAGGPGTGKLYVGGGIELRDLGNSLGLKLAGATGIIVAEALTDVTYTGTASANSKSVAGVAVAQAATITPRPTPSFTPPPINQAPLGQYSSSFTQSLVTVGGGAGGAASGTSGVAGCVGGTVVSYPGSVTAQINSWTQESSTQSSYGTVTFSNTSRTFPVYSATSVTVGDYYLITLASKEMYTGTYGATTTAGGVIVLIMPTAAGGTGIGEMFSSGVITGSATVSPKPPEGGASPSVSAIVRAAVGTAILTPLQSVKGPY